MARRVLQNPWVCMMVACTVYGENASPGLCAVNRGAWDSWRGTAAFLTRPGMRGHPHLIDMSKENGNAQIWKRHFHAVFLYDCFSCVADVTHAYFKLQTGERRCTVVRFWLSIMWRLLRWLNTSRNWLSFSGFNMHGFCVDLTKSKKHPSCMCVVNCPHFNPIPKQLLTISLCLSHCCFFLLLFVMFLLLTL